jgi:hypothetical protein
MHSRAGLEVVVKKILASGGNRNPDHKQSLQGCQGPNKQLTKLFTFAIQTTYLQHNTHQIMNGNGSTRAVESSVGIALGYGLDDRGFRFRFLAGAGNFSLHHRVQSRMALEPTQPPIQ